MEAVLPASPMPLLSSKLSICEIVIIFSQHIFTVIKFCHQWCSTYNGCCSFIIVHWSLFIVSITSLSIGSCRCFFLAGYKYVYGPFFTNSLCMHIIGGTYSLHGYSIGTNGTMGQNLVGGFLQHELN